VIAAIILAAGESKRMGQPKMLLPWGDATVLGQVISVFEKSGVEDIFVVVGAAREQVEPMIDQYNAVIVHNEAYPNGEMLSSLQCGLHAMPSQAQATLICLGDQPQVQEESVRSICEAYQERKSNLIVPSFQLRRGHPWLVARPLWNELFEMNAPASPRDFLNKHAGEIQYVEVNTPTILADLDTPEDYWAARP